MDHVISCNLGKMSNGSFSRELDEIVGYSWVQAMSQYIVV